MTTIANTQSWRMTSDAQFRIAVIWFQTLLTTLGWTKLTEGSPINTGTVTKPTTNNTIAGGYAGFDTFKMGAVGDGLETAYPVHMRVEYYTNGYNASNVTNDANRLKITFQVGLQGTDGSGNLAGNKITTKRSFEICPKTATSGTTGVADADVDATTQQYVSGNAARFSGIFNANAPLATTYGTITDDQFTSGSQHCNGLFGIDVLGWLPNFFTIERTHDKDGNNTNEGVHVIHHGFAGININSSNHVSAVNSLLDYSGSTRGQKFFSQTLLFASGEQSRPQYGWNCIDNSDRQSGMINKDKFVIPIYPKNGGKTFNPVVGLVGCYDFDYELGVNADISIYGTLRNYRKTSQLNKCVFGRNWTYSRIMVAEF